MSASGDEFLTVAEIAALLKVNQMTVRSWIARGELPAHRLGRRVRIRRSDFDSFLERTRIEPTQPDGEQSSAEPSGGKSRLPRRSQTQRRAPSRSTARCRPVHGRPPRPTTHGGRPRGCRRRSAPRPD